MAATTRTLAMIERGLPRRLLSWVAVVVTLAAAVLAARAGSNSALSLAVATASGGANDMLEGVGEALPLGFAFGLGMAAAVNPCGFALLPTYLGLYLGTAAGEQLPWPAQVPHFTQTAFRPRGPSRTPSYGRGGACHRYRRPPVTESCLRET